MRALEFHSLDAPPFFLLLREALSFHVNGNLLIPADPDVAPLRQRKCCGRMGREKDRGRASGAEKMLPLMMMMMMKGVA